MRSRVMRSRAMHSTLVHWTLVHVCSSCAGTYPGGVRLEEFQNKDAYKTRIRGGVARETLHPHSHLSNLFTRRCFKFDQSVGPCDEGDKGVLTPKCMMHQLYHV